MRGYHFVKLILTIVNEKVFSALACIIKITRECCKCLKFTKFGEDNRTIFRNVRIPELLVSKEGGIWVKP
ncbi:MAG: hypothetical protein ACRC0X_03655 [Brevinema sp.]